MLVVYKIIEKNEVSISVRLFQRRYLYEIQQEVWESHQPVREIAGVAF